MISFVKSVALFSAGLIATAAWAEKTGAAATPDPSTSAAGGNKSATGKDGKPGAAGPVKKRVDVPVEKGHDSYGMWIPYFDTAGKRQMNFRIGIASRIDDNHIHMKDLNIETFDEEGKHEMDIYLPTSVLDTDSSVITTDKHVTIQRADFELTGETMIFNTRTKQGGLGGRVRMLIYNLDDETGEEAAAQEAKTKAKASGSESKTPAPQANTPKTKAK